MLDRRSFIETASMGAAASQLLASLEEPASFRSVPTVQALRDEGPTSGAVVFVAGYHRPGDGGGGLFVGNEDAAQADGGTAIAPTGETGTGRWLRWRPSGQYDVRDFGAHPDREDNADAIQACFDAAAEEGRTVRIPPGVYRVSRPIVMRPYVSVEGDGMKSVIQKTTRAPGPSLRRSLPHRDAVDEYDVDCILAVDRPDTDLKFSHDVHIQGIRLRGLAHRTGQSVDRNAYGLYAPRLLRSQLDEVSVADVRAGFHFREIIVSQLDRCWATRAEIGFDLPDLETGGGTSLTMANCYASEVDRWGYYLRGLSYSTLVGCACDHANKEGSGGGYFLGVCHGVTITSCGCEATTAPVLRAKHSELVVSGLKTFGIRGTDARSAYVEVKASTVQFTGCRLPALQDPGQTRNGRYEQGADVTYVSGEQPSGGAPALVDERSSVVCIGERAAESPDATVADATVRADKIGFEAPETTLTPDGVHVDGNAVLRERQPPIGEIVDACGGSASRRIEPVQSGADAATINDNFATLCRQLERIRALLGEDGHGLTEDRMSDS